MWVSHFSPNRAALISFSTVFDQLFMKGKDQYKNVSIEKSLSTIKSRIVWA